MWTHWVDSTTTDEIKDEGDMWASEVNEDETIERGSMKNPESGEVEAYEEIWVDLPLEENGVYWVMKCEDERERVRGVVGGIGYVILNSGAGAEPCLINFVFETSAHELNNFLLRIPTPSADFRRY